MRVAPDVISQHFRTNVLPVHAILVPKKTIFSKREQEVMDKMYCRLKKVEAHATLTGDIMYMEPTYMW